MEDMLNNLSNFLNQIINQLQQTNTITINNLKMLCFIDYQQRTITTNIDIINHLLTTALGLIKFDTIIINQFDQSTNINSKEIFDVSLNDNLKQIYNQGD